MSYHIYNTKGIILSEKSLREADRVYSILTRDLGLIRATALGVRKESSKLRGNLEPVGLTTVSLVRGKEYWRVTSAEVVRRFKKTKPLVLLEQLPLSKRFEGAHQDDHRRLRIMAGTLPSPGMGE